MTMSQATPARAQAVLEFWFGEAAAEPAAVARQYPLWFGAADETDNLIRRRFGADQAAAAAGELDGWAATPRGRLALIVLLDQFSRNLHRRRPEAFAQDARALALTREGLRLGHDQALAPMERGFFYLPLEHAEELAAQEQSVACYRRLLAEAGWREPLQGMLDYAVDHHDTIRRFGRFPHRNAVLERESTAEERAYLDGGAERYGQ
jgi:uncharacterized protein (DUF924 family)